MGVAFYEMHLFDSEFRDVRDFSRLVALLGKEFGRPAIKEMLPMQPGDVPATYADVDDLARDVGFKPATTIEDGIARFSKMASRIWQELNRQATPARET